MFWTHSNIPMQSKIIHHSLHIIFLCRSNIAVQEHLIQKSDVPVLLKCLLSWLCDTEISNVCRLVLVQMRWTAERWSIRLYFLCSPPGWALPVECWDLPEARGDTGDGSKFLSMTDRVDFTLAVCVQADYASVSGCQWGLVLSRVLSMANYCYYSTK